MSTRQVTRCPGCSTRFKVVPDQLRLSQGWVRCGSCHTVFDATKHMEEASTPSSRARREQGDAAPLTMPLDGQVSVSPRTQNPPPEAAEKPPPSAGPPPEDAGGSAKSGNIAPPDALPGDAPAPPPQAPAADADATPPAPAEPEPAPPFEAPPPPVAPTLAQEPPPVTVSGEELPGPQAELVVPEDAIRAHAARTPRADRPRREPGFTNTSNSELTPNSEFKPKRRSRKPRPTDKEPRPSRLSSRDASRRTSSSARRSRRSRSRFADTEFAWPESRLPAQELSFMRQAQRQRFWRRPAVRASLALACVLCGAALAAQVMLQQRDSLAAQHPALVPALQGLCRFSGCEIAPRRAIDDIVISHSGFWRMPKSRLYQLGLSLENRSGAAVAMPAVELTLTDALGMPLLRRVILPGEIDAPTELAAKGEWSVTAPVAIQGVAGPVAGYRAQVFYP